MDPDLHYKPQPRFYGEQQVFFFLQLAALAPSEETVEVKTCLKITGAAEPEQMKQVFQLKVTFCRRQFKFTASLHGPEADVQIMLNDGGR